MAKIIDIEAIRRLRLQRVRKDTNIQVVSTLIDEEMNLEVSTIENNEPYIYVIPMNIGPVRPPEFRKFSFDAYVDYVLAKTEEHHNQ